MQVFKRLSFQAKDRDRPAQLGKAAVLILVGENPGQRAAEILLTKRTHTVETHKGQISFPGGYCEAQDRTMLETALRETEEEIGIGQSQVEILGALPSVLTLGRIEIFPYVGKLGMPPETRLSKKEVERVLYLSVPALLREGLKPVEVEDQDVLVKSRGIYVGTDLVWGATAKMLERLREAVMG